MSKASKFLFLFSFLFFIALLITRIIFGGWRDEMWAPLGLSLFFFFAGIAKDWRVIKDFLTMRTTKHGMNMGILILIAIIGLVCVNFLAVRYEKTFDWTSDNLNSLSDQSVKAAQNLKQDTELVLLYRKAQDSENIQRNVRDIAAMYSNVSKRIQFVSHNALQRPDLAQKYDFDSGPWAFFAVQGERRTRIDAPTEEEITKALIKMGRETKKVVYFTTGHGERDLASTGPEGLSALGESLGVTYEVKPIALFQEGNKVPEDADAVAIIGPQQQFLDTELQALRDYARQGGRLFIALDPGMRHNLAQLTKSLGVEFQNNFVLDLRSQIVGGGPSVVLGTEFSRNDEITKAFQQNTITIFNLGSSLKRAPDAPEELVTESLVSTDAQTMALNELRDQVQFQPNGPHSLAFHIYGQLPGVTQPQATDESQANEDKADETETETESEASDAADKKEFAAVIVGDSDFVTNSIIHNNLNKDLAMNSFASLLSDQDLISIRPKSPKGTKLALTERSFLGLVVGFMIPLPILLFFMGGFVWWRRRTA